MGHWVQARTRIGANSYERAAVPEPGTDTPWYGSIGDAQEIVELLDKYTPPEDDFGVINGTIPAGTPTYDMRRYREMPPK